MLRWELISPAKAGRRKVMTPAMRRFVARQSSYEQVPNPLVEGLLFANFGGISQEETNKRIGVLQAENELVKITESN